MSYRADIDRSWSRVEGVRSEFLVTAFGTIEYAVVGEGTPLLVCHGVLGSHVEGVDGWWAELAGPGFRRIAPSRFGYFGSTLRDDSTPASQANAYAALLDHLGVERVVVLAFSAGSGSALEFAHRHRDRALGLILACCRLGGGVTAGDWMKPLMRAAFGSDRLFWTFKKLMPRSFSRMMGIPKGYRPRADEVSTIAETRELLFPFRPRRDGAVFDGYVSNRRADRFPLEELAVPTLVINARDDPLAPYRYAANAARRIPEARFVSVDEGGHFFMGHADQVRRAITSFVGRLQAGDRTGR